LGSFGSNSAVTVGVHHKSQKIEQNETIAIITPSQNSTR